MSGALGRRSAVLTLFALVASAALTVAEARAGRTSPSDCDVDDDDDACRAALGKAGGKNGK